MTIRQALYLHGFASGPSSAKGCMLADYLDELGVCTALPDLQGPSFYDCTMHDMLARARVAWDALRASDEELLLIGSSLGGYLACQLLAECPAQARTRLLLIAPAFGFVSSWKSLIGNAGISEWRERGSRPFYHHASQAEEELGVGFLESCEPLSDLPPAVSCSGHIIHGMQDQTVPWQASVAYHRRSPQLTLHLVQGEHSLMDAENRRRLRMLVRDCLDMDCDSPEQG